MNKIRIGMKETNIYHLLSQHPVLVFIVSAVLLMTLTMLVIAKLTTRSENRREREDRENDFK